MSQYQSTWRGDARGLTFALIVARFNVEVTEKLLEGAQKALAEANAEHAEVFWVPGAFELPLAAAKLISRFDAVIALGAVIRGGTPHFEYVCAEVASGIQSVILSSHKPVAFGLLTTDNVEQAMERAGGTHGNKGYDAAWVAVEMARFGH
jgi:6,7-dimethyl-8-ribityllumazine synthase